MSGPPYALGAPGNVEWQMRIADGRMWTETHVSWTTMEQYVFSNPVTNTPLYMVHPLDQYVVTLHGPRAQYDVVKRNIGAISAAVGTQITISEPLPPRTKRPTPNRCWRCNECVLV